MPDFILQLNLYSWPIFSMKGSASN